MAIDEELVVGSFAKNKREEVRVTLSRYKGFELVGLRVWFKAEDGAYRPGKSGFSIRTVLLPELVRLLESARVEAAKRGLLDAGVARMAASEEPSGDLQKIVDLLDSQSGGE